jgi:hypothetical protein
MGIADVDCGAVREECPSEKQRHSNHGGAHIPGDFCFHRGRPSPIPSFGVFFDFSLYKRIHETVLHEIVTAGSCLLRVESSSGAGEWQMLRPETPRR